MRCRRLLGQLGWLNSGMPTAEDQPSAAVAVVIAEAPEPSVLVMRRAEHPRDPWSGHWALPGGRCEPEDADLRATAVRETAEECGLHLADSEATTRLPDSWAGRSVGRPVLVGAWRFTIAAPRPLTLDPAEAAEARWLPVAELRDRARHQVAAVPGLPEHAPVPQFAFGAMPLWGFTYRLLLDTLVPELAVGLDDSIG